MGGGGGVEEQLNPYSHRTVYSFNTKDISVCSSKQIAREIVNNDILQAQGFARDTYSEKTGNSGTTRANTNTEITKQETNTLHLIS